MTPPLDAAAENPRAVIGANQPPESIDPSPYDLAEKAVNDIYAETTLWLDGHAIDSQAHADGVGNLLAAIRKAEKQADDARKAEKEPHDKAIKEIQDRYNVLIGDTKAVKGKTVLAAEACKAALAPWLLAEDRRLKEEARLARAEADRKRREAEEAFRMSDAQNLAAREAAEALLSQAKKAETVANVAGKQTATAGGSFGRAAGLRTTWKVTIANETYAARTMWAEAREELVACLQSWAERRVREGVRSLPGFSITEEKTPV